MAENIPIHDETLRKILASTKAEPFPTLTPAGPRNVLPLNCFKEFCNSTSAEFSVLPSGSYPQAGPGCC